MPLTTIFVIRHAFRGSWDTNPHNGEVTSRFPSPTGLTADPPLTAYGERQADELAVLASELDPPVTRIYSSPYYRCLQTIGPFARRLTPQVPVIVDRGLSEWFGEAPWENPSPAEYEDLVPLFPHLDLRPFPGTRKLSQETMEMIREYQGGLKMFKSPPQSNQSRRRVKKASTAAALSSSASSTRQQRRAATSGAEAKRQQYESSLEVYARQLEQLEQQTRQRASAVTSNPSSILATPPLTPHTIIPNPYGESTANLHDRVAYALHQIVATNDEMLADDPEPRSIVVTSHAAPIIGMGRALTGRMPEDPTEEDFCTYTAGVSRFDRRAGWEARSTRDRRSVEVWREGLPVPDVGWRGGRGVGGGWDCTMNSGTSHLSGGGDRDWHFSGDESFMHVEPAGQSSSRRTSGVGDAAGSSLGTESSDKSKL